jgi:hypothetical protein
MSLGRASVPSQSLVGDEAAAKPFYGGEMPMQTAARF